MAALFIGLMSGTSMDAIDAALLNLENETPELVAVKSSAFPTTLRTSLLEAVQSPDPINTTQLGQLDHLLGEEFAKATLDLMQTAQVDASSIRAIGCHGQTIWHAPNELHPFSLQIGDAKLIAARTHITTIADFRSGDIAAGGQGAPLAPAFHAAWLHKPSQDRVVLNIGGMANITILPADVNAAVTGFDTGPGNVLMDGWCQKHRDKHYDENGLWASSGTINSGLLERLLSEPYFASPPPKSTGREQFNLNWLMSYLKGYKDIKPEDVQRTLCELTAVSITDAIKHEAPGRQLVLVCGGGTHNSLLMQCLKNRMPNTSVQTTEAYGINPDWVEAAAFAWLAKQTLHQRPGNLPSVTGADRAVVLGTIYPAS